METAYLHGGRTIAVSMKMDRFYKNFLHNASHHRQDKAMMVYLLYAK